ncbi:hypothetical protein V6N13_004705 [Hibiscus sabdariffa]
MVSWLSRFFTYLDKYFIAGRSLPTLGEVGITCFRDLVYHEVHAQVKDVVIDLIYTEREGQLIDRALLNNVLSIFVEIGMGQMDRYEDDFEAYMLQDTSTYYSRKASSWIEEDSCPEYLFKASQSEECLKKERDRVSDCLHSSSETKLTEKVQNELLVAYANRLFENVHSGCRALLRDDKVEDLSRMSRLYCKIPRGLDPVANIFKQHVIDEGTALVQQAKDATSNQLTVKFDLPATSFHLLFIFRKKYFAELYWKKLARQLLFDRSANDDHERSIPTKLKQQCGRLFTSKLEGMVTDLKLARENQTSFEEYLRSNSAAHPGIDLTVTVLTKGFWPSYKSFDLNLPAEMVMSLNMLLHDDIVTFHTSTNI